MITIDVSGISGHTLLLNTDLHEMTDGLLYRTYTTGSNYLALVGNQMRMDVVYAMTPVVGDTQGAVDFYLQVVD